MATVDHRANLAMRKIGAIPGFEFYEWRCLDDPDGSVMLTGAVVTGTVTKGKRKGKKRWDETRKRVVIITDAEMLAERRRFEREEGKCAECGGDGQAFKSWNHETGTAWRTCVKCGGSGKPLSVGAVDPVGERVTG